MIAVLAVALGSTPARASLPLTTEDLFTVAMRQVEIELQSDTAAPADEPGLELAQGFLVHTGITSSLELALGGALLGQVRSGETRWALSDAYLQVVWRMIDQKGASPAFGARLIYPLSQSTSEQVEGHLVQGLFILQWQLAPHLVLVNLGGAIRTDNRGRLRFNARGSAAYVFSAGEHLDLVAEAINRTEIERTTVVRGLVGAVWTAATELVISVGVGPSWADPGRFGWLAIIGFTFTYPPGPRPQKTLLEAPP